jgi:hypothetical protein
MPEGSFLEKETLRQKHGKLDEMLSILLWKGLFKLPPLLILTVLPFHGTSTGYLPTSLRQAFHSQFCPDHCPFLFTEKF